MATQIRPPGTLPEAPVVDEPEVPLDDIIHLIPTAPVRAAPPPPPRPTADAGGEMSAGAYWTLLAGLSTIFLLALGMFAWLIAGPTIKMPSAQLMASPSAPAAAPAAAAPVQAANGAVEIVASEFKFAPAQLSLPGAGSLNVTLKNTGAVEHDVVFEGVDGMVHAAAGQTAKGAFQFARDGVYTFFCSIPGHKEAGMVGNLTVGAAAAAAPVAAGGAAAAPEVKVAPAVQGAKPLPTPAIAPPIARRTPEFVKVELETREVTAQLADGQTYTFWTFGGTVPGPMVRVRQGDTVEVTLKNAADSKVTHSIDFHAVTGPGGGAKATQVPPGQSATFTFKALNPGVYVYHCATPMVAHHISAGMYGLIVVEPEAGLPTVDREYYVMQGDLYVQGKRTEAGHREHSVEKMLDERADFVMFNGSVGSVTGERALKAKVGETVRIFFGVGGPNLTSSFHVIGEIFDRVHPEGSTETATNVQTTLVPSGGATMVEFTVEVPGTYALVDHSLGRLEKGGAGHLVVEGPENPEVFKVVKEGSSGGGGH
jgi:nitrite reductase (NO-forming)